MTPGAINITGGSKEPLSISFDDNKGVTLTSPKKLTLNADNEIVIKTPKTVTVKGESKVSVLKSKSSNGFSIETDMHFLGSNVIKNGTCRETYAPFDDEPKAGKKPEPVKKEEKKKGFSWGKLAKGVLAGLAVVAVVVVAAVAIAATAGLATGAIVAIGVGAAIAGTAAVASQAFSDKSRGEVSDASTYMLAGAREAFIGAVSGAIFGPFGATEALGGKMLLGGVTNSFESIVRQKLNGEDLNLGTVLFDAGIGAGTAGMFHGAGKVFEKSSPFIKKAINKVGSEISENAKIAKIAFSNMNKGPRPVVLGSNLGNVDEAIDRFAKEFKNAKDVGIEIIDKDTKIFKIKNWDDYPDDYVPKPDENKIWKILEGDEYNQARKEANKVNGKTRKNDPSLKEDKLEIHEVEPVKFGGSPTDEINKVYVQSKVHRKYVTPWWNKVRDAVKKELGKDD